MGLLARYRRIWVAIFVGVLWLPIIGHALLPYETVSEFEGRFLKAPPDLPKTAHESASLPRLLDAFLADHFGFRKQLTMANALFRYELSSPTNEFVLYGRNGYLFYLGAASVHQSTGLLLRREHVKKFVDSASDLHDRLAKQNIAFVVAIPPNASTINRAQLPEWLPRSPSFTEYDLALEMFASRGVPAVDLRPAMQPRDSQPRYYRTDTHWNALGAAIARNEIVRFLGLPEWELDIDRVFRGFRPVAGLDLARFLGISFAIQDQWADIDISSYPRGEGPTVLAIGDSFVDVYFPKVWANGGRLDVMAVLPCSVDFDAVMIRKPSIVVLAPTERNIVCS
jgi:alginate O-acetyltransferase complex protein AlgJ